MEEAFDLWDVCFPYWEAYLTLHRSRGMAIGPMSAVPLPLVYSEIETYAKSHGLADTIAELDETVLLVTQLDQLYLKHAEENQPK